MAVAVAPDLVRQAVEEGIARGRFGEEEVAEVVAWLDGFGEGGVMARRYATPAAFKAALEQRLRSRAAGVSPPRIRAYPLETHIAEKLHAYTMPRHRPNSRVKDLPDLALLGMVRDIDAATLRAAIEQTWAHRGTHPVRSEWV